MSHIAKTANISVSLVSNYIKVSYYIQVKPNAGYSYPVFSINKHTIIIRFLLHLFHLYKKNLEEDKDYIFEKLKRHSCLPKVRVSSRLI